MRQFSGLMLLVLLLYAGLNAPVPMEEAVPLMDESLYRQEEVNETDRLCLDFSAEAAPGEEADFEALMQATIGITSRRLLDSGYADSTVARDGAAGIHVEVSGVAKPKSPQALTALNDVIALAGAPGQLTFTGPDGAVLMDNAMIAGAEYLYDMGDHQVMFTLTAAGTEIFAEATAAHVGEKIAIILDGVELLAATVQAPITSGSGLITHLESEVHARAIAAQMRSGVLPLTLTLENFGTIPEEAEQ